MWCHTELKKIHIFLNTQCVGIGANAKNWFFSIPQMAHNYHTLRRNGWVCRERSEALRKVYLKNAGQWKVRITRLSVGAQNQICSKIFPKKSTSLESPSLLAQVCACENNFLNSPRHGLELGTLRSVGELSTFRPWPLEKSFKCCYI